MSVAQKRIEIRNPLPQSEGGTGMAFMTKRIEIRVRHSKRCFLLRYGFQAEEN